MDEKERTMAVFAQTSIEGLDFASGVTRFGGNPKLYTRIIKTFVDNIGAHLDTLAALSPEGLEAYGIEVHGVKGSLYGISANKEGDMAKALEMAAKEGDYAKVSEGNGPFIEAVKELVRKLEALLAELDSAAGSGLKKPEPEKATLAVMLHASREFNVEQMQEALKELEKFEYEKDGDLVKWLGEQVTAFGYDRIEERLRLLV